MRVISPLFLDDLTERLQKAWESAPALKRLWTEIGKMNFLDPASGSGNFLLVAYKKLRELELKLLARLRELEGKDTQLALDGSIGLQVHLGQFHAIEYDEWSSQIAFVAMFLADHQANKQMEEILGASPNRFPLTESAVVKQGNALRISWDSVCPMNENTVIMGNPPFNGYAMLTPEQRDDTSEVWKGVRGSGVLDYVANWLLIGARWAKEQGVRVAFVATNSITQGEQPSILWGKLFQLEVGIDFAYRTFQWDNGAAVHCVIIGYSTLPKPKKRALWLFPDPKGEPELVMADSINPYLIDGPDILVSSRTRPIIESFQIMEKGNIPTDDGFLSSISASQAAQIRETDPIASKYLRRLVGARELINNSERYCLWLVDAEPSDIRKSPELSTRVSEVKRFRLSSKKEITRRDANRAHEFQEIRQPKGNYIAVPRVSSELRDYVPIARLSPEIINTDALMVINDGSLRTFGILMSKPFNVWNKTVSGRLESRVRISGTITYNNFPFPTTSAAETKAIEEAAEGILSAREAFPKSSLADLYDSDVMPTELRKAHEKLDKAVMSALGLRLTATDEAILSELFKRYEELTRGLI